MFLKEIKKAWDHSNFVLNRSIYNLLLSKYTYNLYFTKFPTRCYAFYPSQYEAVKKMCSKRKKRRKKFLKKKHKKGITCDIYKLKMELANSFDELILTRCEIMEKYKK